MRCRVEASCAVTALAGVQIEGLGVDSVDVTTTTRRVLIENRLLHEKPRSSTSFMTLFDHRRNHRSRFDAENTKNGNPRCPCHGPQYIAANASSNPALRKFSIMSQPKF